jgi:long-chain fatty acid transport protein
MNTKKLFSLFGAIVFIAAFSIPALADSYHYKNIIVGDRASGMGGAYTAISDDPSGLYYNPAGIVYSQGTNVSASANAYHNTKKDYSNVLGGLGWTRKASSLLPNFFGVVQKMGKGRFGLAYVVPDSIVEDQDQVFHDLQSSFGPLITDYYLNFNNEDSIHNFGLGYAREITETLSWGVSLFYHHRRIQRILNQTLLFNDGESEWVNTYYESEEDGVMPVLGMMWTPAEKYSFGLSVSRVYITGSRTTFQGEAQLHTLNPNYASSAAIVSTSRTGERRIYPLNVNFGGAYFASETFLVSADVNYYSSTRDEEFLLDYERTWAANFSVGTEYYYSPNIALRAGIYSNMSAAPEIKAGTDSVTEDDVDLIGLSASVSHFGRGSSLTLGFGYAAGSGDSQVSGDNTKIQTADYSSWTIYLSNAYGF